MVGILVRPGAAAHSSPRWVSAAESGSLRLHRWHPGAVALPEKDLYRVSNILPSVFSRALGKEFLCRVPVFAERII
jgi:hypothetical protein